MDEGSLVVHEIELVVDSVEDLSNGGVVGEHAASTRNLAHLASLNLRLRLTVDTSLETSGAPVDELDGLLSLDGADGVGNILRKDITSVHEGASHVLTALRIALAHHRRRIEERVGNLSNRHVLKSSLLSSNDRGVGGEHEVDSGVGNEVGLELVDIDVEGTVEAEGGSHGGDDLGNESVEVGVAGSLNAEVGAAEIVDGLVVEDDADIGVLEESVGGEDGVVGLNDGGGELRRGVDGEGKLGLLAVEGGEVLEEERTETGTGTSTDGVEDEEALEGVAGIGGLTDSVEDEVDDLLADGVATTGEVVGGVLLAGDELLGVVHVLVGTSADLVNDGGLEIDENGTRNTLAGASLLEHGSKALSVLAGVHELTVLVDTVLQAVQFPAGITDLNTGLTDVERDNFTHV